MKQLILPMKEQYEEYLTDESKFTGWADSISFPETEEEICLVLKELLKEQIPVTVQGGKTGITGGAVPQGGHIMNLSRMNHVKKNFLMEDGTGRVIVEPGINLMDLEKEIGQLFRNSPMFWPPDPTETTATIGGIAASDAQGITRLLYGNTENYIESLRLINSEGEITEVRKGQKIKLPDGTEKEFLDAVLGKEGITGIISELTLMLLPKPESMWGIGFFFENEEDTGRFADLLRADMPSCLHARIAAVEYMDRRSMDLIEQRKTSMSKIKELPDVPEAVSGMMYIEIHGKEEDIESIAEALMEAAMECGSDPDEAWAVSGETEIEKMRAFRHGAAETSNLFIEEVHRKDQRITKLGTDMSLNEMRFSDVLACCRRDLQNSGLQGSVFGHVMENHLHVNILPADYVEYEAGVELFRRWAACVEESNGKVVGEHGIGKLKQKVLGEYLPVGYIEMCQKLRRKLERNEGINQGNILS